MVRNSWQKAVAEPSLEGWRRNSGAKGKEVPAERLLRRMKAGLSQKLPSLAVLSFTWTVCSSLTLAERWRRGVPFYRCRTDSEVVLPCIPYLVGGGSGTWVPCHPTQACALISLPVLGGVGVVSAHSLRKQSEAACSSLGL